MDCAANSERELLEGDLANRKNRDWQVLKTPTFLPEKGKAFRQEKTGKHLITNNKYKELCGEKTASKKWLQNHTNKQTNQPTNQIN